MTVLGLSPVGRPLEGKVVVVTGASRGLGRGMAEGVAHAGATTVAVARSKEGLEATATAIRDAGGEVATIVCDVADEGSVESLAREVESRFGRVDVLVNNAGVAWERPVLEMPLSEFRETLDVNVLGPFLVSKALGRLMVDRKQGKIINIGSIDAIVGAPNLVHYCSSKGAVVQFTRALAAEWAKFGITVNCLSPGYFPTDINRERLNEGPVRDKILGRIPMRRFGEVPEIVSWVVFLAGEGSDYLTGQIITVDGGESAR